jgi:hypothetical protein
MVRLRVRLATPDNFLLEGRGAREIQPEDDPVQYLLSFCGPM